MNYIKMITDCVKKGMGDKDIIRFIDNAYGIHDRGRNPRYTEYDKHAEKITLEDIKRTRQDMITG